MSVEGGIFDVVIDFCPLRSYIDTEIPTYVNYAFRHSS